MEFIGFAIASVLIVTAFGLAWHQSRRAKHARRALTIAVDELPAKVVNATQFVLRLARGESAEPWCGAIDFRDVNNDGTRELLVQHPAGAHGSALHVLAWRDGEFHESGSLRTDTPVGFEFADFDGDGNTEIRTKETDWSAGLPYVEAPRFEVLFRWDGTTFIQIAKNRDEGE